MSQAIKERVAELEALKQAEEASATRSQTYIDDLNLSIKDCKRGLNVKEEASIFKMI